MNKTLLIVICDFLLLSMLGMISFDDLPTKQESKDDSLVVPYADSQLLDLLKMSLDKERESKDNLSSRAKEVEDISKEQALELAKKQEELALLQSEKDKSLEEAKELEEKLLSESLAKQELEEEKAKALSLVEQERLAKEALESENLKTLESAKALELELQKQASSKQNLEAKLGEMSQSDAYLKARLEAMQAELESAKASTQSLRAENAQMQKKSEELSTQLEVANTKVNIYQEDLERTQGLVLQEKTEKQQIQRHAQSLAKGVDKLADNQTKLIDSQEKIARQVEDMRPLSASEIYETFKENALNIDFVYKRNSTFGNGETKLSFRTAVVEINGGYWALFSTKGTPFDRAKDKFFSPDDLVISPWAKGFKLSVSNLYYVKGTTNVFAVSIAKAFVEKTNLKVYKASENPFKYSEATIIDTADFYYGQLKYSVDEKYAGIAKVDSSFFASIVGDFSPSRGDLVFDRTGGFLGIMTSGSDLSLVRNFVASAPLPLLTKYNKIQAKNFFDSMKSAK